MGSITKKGYVSQKYIYVGDGIAFFFKNILVTIHVSYFSTPTPPTLKITYPESRLGHCRELYVRAI